jgi:hypothetical protein
MLGNEPHSKLCKLRCALRHPGIKALQQKVKAAANSSNRGQSVWNMTSAST